MGTAGFNRHLLLGVEGTWGVWVAPGLAVPLASGEANLAEVNEYHEPDSNLGGFETIQINDRQLVRGRFTALLHKDAGHRVLEMGIVRQTGGPGMGNLQSYTIALMSPAGGRQVIGALSQRMELSVNRNTGAVTVAHEIVGKKEEAGPSYTPPMYAPENPVSSKYISVTVAGSAVTKLETVRLVVANRLILGPTGSDGFMVGCLAGRRRITMNIVAWAENSGWLDYVRNQSTVSVAVDIACPGAGTWTLTMPTMKPLCCVEEGRAEEAVRYVLDLVASKPTNQEAIVLSGV